MRKPILIGLILYILAVLVSGVSAASPEKVVSFSTTLSENANAYGAPRSSGDSYAAAGAYTGVSIGKKGVSLTGSTYTYVCGGPGTSAYTTSTISGNIG